MADRRFLSDRIGIAVRTLVAAGLPVDPETALIGAGLEFHTDRDALAEQVPRLAEQMRGAALSPDAGRS